MTASFPALDDFELIARYTDQPSRLPAAARVAALRLSCDSNVIAYALIDLDEQLRLNEGWLVLTPSSVVCLHPEREPFAAPRKAVKGCAVERGVSCNTLRVDLSGDTAPLLARYTQRQSSAVERIVALLEHDSIEGEPPAGGDAADTADERYAAEVVRPLRDAQALVSRNGLFIIARLLRYLLPYKRQLGLGLGAAALITL